MFWTPFGATLKMTVSNLASADVALDVAHTSLFALILAREEATAWHENWG
jgi:hypothetical protein